MEDVNDINRQPLPVVLTNRHLSCFPLDEVVTVVLQDPRSCSEAVDVFVLFFGRVPVSV
jgi:hypothetical protein